MTRRMLLGALLRYPPGKSRTVSLLLLVAVVWLAAACVSTDLPPIGSSGSGAFALETDERRLWSALEQAEGRVAPAKYLYTDPQLTGYLEGLVTKLTPDGYRAAGGPSLRVQVKKDPRLNAFAMAHGLIVVNSGVVARAENEAQLAAVLAHELAHIIDRHQIRAARGIQNRQTAINVAAFLGTLTLTAAAVVAVDHHQGPAAVEAITTAGTALLRVGLQLS